MSKRSRRSSSGGGLLSKANLIKMALGAAVSVWAYNHLAKSAGDSTQKDSITNKVAGALGFTGAGIA